MTTREEIVAAAKEVDPSIDETTVDFDDEVGMKRLERFYAIAFEAGAESVRKALMDGDTYGYGVRVGAASRDAEIKGLEASLDLVRHERNNLDETVGKLDAEIAELKQEHINCALSLDECEQERDKLRTELEAALHFEKQSADTLKRREIELVNALAACKAKDEQLFRLQAALKKTYSLTPEGRVELTRLASVIAIQPGTEALEKWLGEPVAFIFQHEDTGRTMCIEVQQVEWNFEKNNPRLFKCGPLYSPKGLK